MKGDFQIHSKHILAMSEEDTTRTSGDNTTYAEDWCHTDNLTHRNSHHSADLVRELRYRWKGDNIQLTVCICSRHHLVSPVLAYCHMTWTLILHLGQRCQDGIHIKNVPAIQSISWTENTTEHPSTTQREGRRYREPSAHSAMKPRQDDPVAGVDGDVLRGTPRSQEIESSGMDYRVKPRRFFRALNRIWDKSRPC